tara:strand:- start:246 stop:947 length:702 start_codon:yes stop_codon:yes gene_type:complete
VIRDASLVLVPGLLCDEDLWFDQIESLSNITEISVADTLSDDNIAGMAARLLANAPPQFALAGLSMGGYVALEVMRQAPRRVTRLALLSTNAEQDNAEKSRIRRGLITLAEKGKFKGVSPRLLPMLLHESRLNDTVLCDRVVKMAARVGKDCFVRQQKAIMLRSDSRKNLCLIKVPSIVLCGREDLLTNLSQHEELAKAIPGAELKVIDHCGHLPTMERPQEVTSLLRSWMLR